MSRSPFISIRNSKIPEINYKILSQDLVLALGNCSIYDPFFLSFDGHVSFLEAVITSVLVLEDFETTLVRITLKIS